jgi:hypothetical protein
MSAFSSGRSSSSARGASSAARRRHFTAEPQAQTALPSSAAAASPEGLWPPLFRLWLDGNQRWQVETDRPGAPIGVFAELEEAVAFAKHACRGAAATVELHIDDFYAVVHQEPGWPNPICGKRAA